MTGHLSACTASMGCRNNQDAAAAARSAAAAALRVAFGSMPRAMSACPISPYVYAFVLAATVVASVVVCTVLLVLLDKGANTIGGVVWDPRAAG